MLVSDFTYELPEERIASKPPKERGSSRLLILNKNDGSIDHGKYADLGAHLNRGDLLIINDTQVIKARISLINSRGKPREILLLEKHADASPFKMPAMYRGKLRAGEKLKVANSIIKVLSVEDGGIAIVQSKESLLDIAELHGTVPLPPYMHREATKDDIERYQTVFAEKAGSVAAPTASLNFTQELQDDLTAKGIGVSKLTLHVGLGTFLPIRTDNIEAHRMHSEYFMIPKDTITAIRATKASGGRVIALGTTVTRTLEYAAEQIYQSGQEQIAGEADIFIYPGYSFQIVDAMLTNFHAPKSTVLMMAAAFAGWDNLKHAYAQAIDEQYNFLSYGDSMLIK